MPQPQLIFFILLVDLAFVASSSTVIALCWGVGGGQDMGALLAERGLDHVAGAQHHDHREWHSLLRLR